MRPPANHQIIGLSGPPGVPARHWPRFWRRLLSGRFLAMPACLYSTSALNNASAASL
jgi:hypothetical protein